ncbi:hypothetical protein HanHA89_Chr17g0728251 [Helianthus annuus]|nr:hypothetical protein HanHA89_Chr17g0728251 [Helianthus annuus]
MARLFSNFNAIKSYGACITMCVICNYVRNCTSWKRYDFGYMSYVGLVCWFVVRFRAEGLSGSSLSIPVDRGKVCLHPTLPRPYK